MRQQRRQFNLEYRVNFRSSEIFGKILYPPKKKKTKKKEKKKRKDCCEKEAKSILILKYDLKTQLTE